MLSINTINFNSCHRRGVHKAKSLNLGSPEYQVGLLQKETMPLQIEMVP
jgi:hypothetical protein